MIEPSTPKGFRDYLPATMRVREQIIATAQRVYRSFGFAGIETPALEFFETLTGKGGDESDRQMFHFVDHGNRHVGLRFDLTVPLARYYSQHAADLGTPFKRYHIGPVWRGENTQKGRYREFVQCDFDTVGTESLAADIETALVIDELLRAIGIEKFRVRINNRKVLIGILQKLGLESQSVAVLRVIDKLTKTSEEKVLRELVDSAICNEQQGRDVLALAQLKGDTDEILRGLDNLAIGNELAMRGAAELREVIGGARAAGVTESRLQLDPSIARGLDYYTGTIFETFLDAMPNIGSVCSGGRYDNLTTMFMKQKAPGIGASLGLDRLVAALEELDILQSSYSADVFIPFFDKTRLYDYIALAAKLRSLGFSVEVFPDPKKLGQQLQYADRKGFKIALIQGESEFAAKTIQLKNLKTTTSQVISLESGFEPLAAEIREILEVSEERWSEK